MRKHLHHSRGRKKGYIVVRAVCKRSGLAENVPGRGGGGGAVTWCGVEEAARQGEGSDRIRQ